MDKHIKGALLVCLAATMWGFDGIALTPRLFNLHVPFVVFYSSSLTFNTDVSYFW